jgi:hypothetical protein
VRAKYCQCIRVRLAHHGMEKLRHASVDFSSNRRGGPVDTLLPRHPIHLFVLLRLSVDQVCLRLYNRKSNARRSQFAWLSLTFGL